MVLTRSQYQMWNAPDEDTPGQYPGVVRKAAYDAVCQLLGNAAIPLGQKIDQLSRFIEEEGDVAFEFTRIRRSALGDAAIQRLNHLRNQNPPGIMQQPIF